jgi:hypothetical protein
VCGSLRIGVGLVERGIVTGSGMDSEGRQALRWHQLHLHFTPLTVPLHGFWVVSEHILVAQLGGDFDGDVAHVGEVVDAEHAAAGFFAEVVEEHGAGALLGGGGVGVEDADGVDFDVGLADLGFDFAFGVAGAVVAAVGDDEQGFALVAGGLHFVHAVVDGVEQGGAVAGADGLQAGFDVVDGAGEIFDELGAVVEADDEELILGVGGFHELEDGVAGADELGGHGAGEVHDDADGDGGVFAGEGFELLLGVVFVDEKVVLLEAGDEAVHGVGDGDGDEDEVDVHADAGAGAGFEGVVSGEGGQLRLRRARRWRGGGGGGVRDVDFVEGVVLFRSRFVLWMGTRRGSIWTSDCLLRCRFRGLGSD